MCAHVGLVTGDRWRADARFLERALATVEWCPLPRNVRAYREEITMAAMKPRTGDGPMEVVKEGRSYVMRVPLEVGGRLVVEITADEVKELGDALFGALNPPA